MVAHEIERCLDQIETSLLTKDTIDLIQRQRELLQQRNSEREHQIDAAVAGSVYALRNEIARIDGLVAKAMADNDAEKVRFIEAGEWRAIKDVIGSLERSLDHDLIQPLKNKWMPHIADLQLAAFDLDGKLRRFKTMMENRLKKHQKILQNLAAFSKWVNLVSFGTIFLKF